MAQVRSGHQSGGLLGLAQLSILGGAAGANSTLPNIDQSIPGIGYLQELLSSWFQLDITRVLIISTLFGTLFNSIKDLQGLTVKIYWWFTKLFTASISIGSNDRLNREIINWIGSNVLEKQKTRVLTARSEVIENDAYSWRSQRIERNELYEKRVPIQFLPTFGTTWFFHNGAVFLVRRISQKTKYLSDNNIPDEYVDAPEGDEPLVVMCLGRSVKPIKRFLETCRDFGEKQREAFITIRASKNDYGQDHWATTILRPIRSLSTVHFDEEEKEALVADIRNYLDPRTRKFYTSRGIPYRRGFLLHGTPGTGKTSLSLALAGLFGLELYLVHLPSVREDQDLSNMFATLPPRCIVLLEDIDAVGIKRRSGLGSMEDDENESDDEAGEEDDDSIKGSSNCRCTLSGLLNVLDGVASQEGRIVLMTSNHAEKLDKALIRPGRIDKKICLGPISQRSAELMFLRMYSPDLELGLEMDFGLADGELEKLALKFSREIIEKTFTPAQLQGYLLNHRDYPTRAAAEIKAWVDEEMAAMKEQKAQEKQAKQKRAQKKKDRILSALAKLEKEVAGDEKDGVDVAGELKVNGLVADGENVANSDASVKEDIKEDIAVTEKDTILKVGPTEDVASQ